MEFITSQQSPIDRAVQSLTTFSGFKAANEEDWHSQFAADIDREELTRSPLANSKHESLGPNMTVQQPQPEGLATQKGNQLPHDVPLAGSSSSRNQQPLSKFTPFVRPSSSHEDKSASFAFGKPQPKQLDFGRKRTPDINLCIPATLPEPCANSSLSPEACHSTTTTSTTTETTATHEGMQVPTKAASLLLSVDISPTLTTSLDDTGSLKAHEDTSSTTEKSPIPATTAPNPQSLPVIVPKTMAASQDKIGEPVGSSSIAIMGTPLTFPRVLTKVANIRRKSKRRTDSNTTKASQSTGVNTSLSYEDTLNILLRRYRNEQLDREETRVALKAKETELQDLTEISRTIYHQLQQVLQQKKSQEAELSRFHIIMPQWERQIKKLNNYIQSLTNDHQTLREDAQQIRNQQMTLQADRSELALALKGIHQDVEQDHGKTKKVLVEARHHMEMLGQTVSNQEAQLREDGDLLNAERDRSQRLEDEISKLSTGHQHLLDLLIEHRKTSTEKLDDLLSKSEEVQTITPLPAQDYMMPVLNEAVSLLKELRDVDVVTAEDLRKLEASVSSYAESLTGSIKSCEETAAYNGACQKEFASGLQERLQALGASITTEHVLIERVTDLREMKATFGERVQATRVSLAEARQQIIGFENKDQLQLQKILALELEVAQLRNRPTESPHTIFRVHDLEAQNKDLQERSITLQKQAAELSGQLQQKVDKVAEAETQLNNLRSQLEEANADKFALEGQKVAYKSQFEADLEQARRNMWKAADLDKARAESSYQNRLHQLQQQRTEMDAKLQQHAEELSQLRAQKDAAEAELGQSLSLLAGLRADKAKEDETSATLQFRVTQLETETEEKDARFAQLEERLKVARNELEAKDVHVQRLGHIEEKLRLTTNELEAKDAQIQRLTASSVLSLTTDSVQSSTPKDPEHPKRMANRAEKRLPTVVEDSQPNDVQTSTIVKTVPEESNKISTPSRYPQNQAIGKSLLSSPLGDLDDMLDDLGDLAELFSPTPLQAAQTPKSSKKATTHATGSAEISPTRRFNVSHESQSSTRKSIHFSQPSNYKPSYTATTLVPQVHRADHPLQALTHDKHDAQGQQAISKQSSRRHSILKESTVEKRSASVAGLNSTDARSTSKRVKDLGPVIPDSQSPHGSRIPARNHRPAKLNSRKQPKDDKYSRRFSQELKPEL